MSFTKRRFLNFCIALVFFIETSAFGAELSCANADNIIQHQVQSGETISSILFNRALSPLWGHHGYVQKVYAMNKGHLHTAEKVLVGQKISIPAGCEPTLLSIKNEENVSPLRNIAVEPKTETPKIILPEISGPKNSPTQQITQTLEMVEDSQFLITLGGGYSRINSTQISNNATAVLLSKPSSSYSIRWEQNWSDLVHSFISWNNQTLNFSDAHNSTTILDGIQNLTELSFGGRYQIGNFGEFEMALGSGDSIFVPTYSLGTVTLEVKNLPFARIEFQHAIARVRSLSLKGGLGATFISSTSVDNYEIEPGQSFHGFLRVSQQLNHFSLFAETQYEECQQSTSFSNHNRKGLLGRLGFSWGLGK